jgi:hypothetical protein
MALVKEIEQQKKEYLNDFIDNDKKADSTRFSESL